MDIFWEQLRKVILAEMKEQDISKADLARRLGWPAPHVNRYLGSEEKPSEETREPGLSKINEMAVAINKPLAELIQRATSASGVKIVAAAPGRDAMIGKLMCQLCDMSIEELESVSNTVRLMKEKLAAKRSAGKKTSQAG